MSSLNTSGTATSSKIACQGHSGSQTPQSINALIRMDVELVGEGLPLLPLILINAVHWTDRPPPEVARQRRTPSVFKVNTQGAFVICADRVREWLVAATSR